MNEIEIHLTCTPQQCMQPLLQDSNNHITIHFATVTNTVNNTVLNKNKSFIRTVLMRTPHLTPWTGFDSQLGMTETDASALVCKGFCQLQWRLKTSDESSWLASSMQYL